MSSLVLSLDTNISQLKPLNFSHQREIGVSAGPFPATYLEREELSTFAACGIYQ